MIAVNPGQTGRLLRRSAIILAVLLTAILGCWLFRIERGPNFHIVEDGQFYRAGRMSPDMMEQLVRQYGIRSVVNLEGARPEKAWYQAEVAELDKLHVRRYDFRLSATRIAPPVDVAALLDVMRTAPRPLLVHCRNGVDRSGLVAALYLAKVRNYNEDDAYDQLSMAYGHFQYLWSATEEMDDTYWASVDPDHDPD